MKPPRFEYCAPKTVAETVSLLAQHDGEAKILAGGQSLMPLLNMRMARPELLVDVNRLPDLDFIREEAGTLVIGALARQRQVERSALVKERLPLLHAATRFIAHPQIRNRGTFGGSIAHADPAAEGPAIALALDAEMRLVGSEGERRVPASEFFVTYLTTAMEPEEMLTEVRLPIPEERTGWAFQEVARRHGDFALAGVAVTMALGGAGRIEAARVALFGVGATPLRAAAVESMLAGEAPAETLFEAAGRQAAAAVEEPPEDVHGTPEYRRHLAAVLTRRALAEAARRAGGAG